MLHDSGGAPVVIPLRLPRAGAYCRLHARPSFRGPNQERSSDVGTWARNRLLGASWLIRPVFG